MEQNFCISYVVSENVIVLELYCLLTSIASENSNEPKHETQIGKGFREHCCGSFLFEVMTI